MYIVYNNNFGAKMEIVQHSDSSIKTIDAYAKNTFLIGDQCISHSFILTAQSMQKWEATDTKTIATHLHPILSLHADIILFGLTDVNAQLDKNTYKILHEHGAKFEVMNAVSAAKTYNALCLEYRNVLAAIIINSSTT